MQKVSLTKMLSALALTTAAFVLGSSPTSAQGQSGTTLTATKTAEGSFERRVDYDWSLTKSASPSSLNFDGQQTRDVTYTLNATRTQVSDTTVVEVTGEICVTNGGAVATENLTLVDQVEYKLGSGQFQPLMGATQTITPAQLAAGESSCYPYTIAFAPVDGAEYRNSVQVTITNHSGSLGELKGPNPKADFSIPAEPVLVETDATASIADALTCPTGFTCTYVPNVNSWNLTGSQTITYMVQVARTSALCGQSFTLNNTATLTEGTTGQTRPASAAVGLMTETCPVTPPPVGGACTRTIGYWKTHAGFGPQANALGQHLPVWLGTPAGLRSVNVTTTTQAVDLLNKSGKASNGINNLYAQLLATKVNIKAGAPDTTVAALITQADLFLAQYNSNSWNGLSAAQKSQVLNWATQFDAYNNGLMGPAHCQ